MSLESFHRINRCAVTVRGWMLVIEIVRCAENDSVFLSGVMSQFFKAQLRKLKYRIGDIRRNLLDARSKAAAGGRRT